VVHAQEEGDTVGRPYLLRLAMPEFQEPVVINSHLEKKEGASVLFQMLPNLVTQIVANKHVSELTGPNFSTEETEIDPSIFQQRFSTQN
jgi:hypothetical protein